MLSQFTTAPYLPFAIAFVVMIGIGLIEAIGLGLGHLDLHGGSDTEGLHGLLDWLGLGRELPVLIWLTSLLGCFTFAGLALQRTTTALVGEPLPLWLACGGALLAGGALNTLVANGLMRVMPGFETTAISTDELLRRRGTVLEGTARRGAPARAKVIDQHGQAHVIMVEPHHDNDAIASGESALIVRREGPIFFVVPDNNTLLHTV